MRLDCCTLEITTLSHPKPPGSPRCSLQMPHKTEGGPFPDHPGCLWKHHKPRLQDWMVPFHGCAVLGVRPVWMCGKPAQPNLPGSGSWGREEETPTPELQKENPTSHGGRGKQYSINNSAAPVPQELAQLSNRT